METKNILQILTLFVIGMAGGIFADQIIWPYFIERPLFQQYRLEQSPTYVTERLETTLYVQENTAIRQSVQDVLPAIVGVKTKTVSGEILEGSGLVVTSDGLIVTLASLVPKGSEFLFFVDGKWPAFQILKRDLENDLALIKVEKGGLKTRGFADLSKIKLAEPVFLVGTDFSGAIATSTLPQNTANTGIVTTFNQELIQTNIFEKKTMAGSPLFDMGGRGGGSSFLGRAAKFSPLPATLIRAFAGF